MKEKKKRSRRHWTDRRVIDQTSSLYDMTEAKR